MSSCSAIASGRYRSSHFWRMSLLALRYAAVDGEKKRDTWSDVFDNQSSLQPVNPASANEWKLSLGVSAGGCPGKRTGRPLLISSPAQFLSAISLCEQCGAQGRL